MPPTPQELSLLLHPLVPESIAHNTRVSCARTLPPTLLPSLLDVSTNPYLLLPQTLSNIRSISSLLLGISAGILGLESINGFLYYILGSLAVSVFIHFLLVEGQPETYFAGNGERGVDGKKGGTGAWREVWFGGGVLGEALSGYVLGWAGVGGLIR
jgi:hypothetical protein